MDVRVWTPAMVGKVDDGRVCMGVQVMDAGRLTDGRGRSVDFTNALVILTSNIGADYLTSDSDPGVSESARAAVMREVRARLRPEFLNRLDDVVIFHRLTEDQLRVIVKLLLEELARPLAERAVRVSAEPDAVDQVCDRPRG